MIIGKPCIISNARKLEIAVLTGIPYDDIEAFIDSSVKIVNEQEHINVINHSPSTATQWLENSVVINNTIYIKLLAATNQNFIFRAVLEAVLYIFCDFSVPVANRRADAMAACLQEVARLNEKIADHVFDIKLMYDRILPIKRNDWVAFVKACKKLKLRPIETEESIAFTFTNIKTGNDIEGYVQYKGITFVWSKEKNTVVNVVYHFSKFTLATSFELRLALHPHISTDGEVCYGNRSEDMGIYKAANSYEYILDLLRDTVMSYNPESPYANITKIAIYLRALNAVVPKDRNRLTKIRSDIEISEAWYNSIASDIKQCRYCHQYLDGDACRTHNCIYNELAIINCADCGQQLIWDIFRRRLTCPGHFICSVCGSTSIGSVCTYPSCSTNSEVIDV